MNFPLEEKKEDQLFFYVLIFYGKRENLLLMCNVKRPSVIKSFKSSIHGTYKNGNKYIQE